MTAASKLLFLALCFALWASCASYQQTTQDDDYNTTESVAPPFIKKIDTVACGKQPKQVIFSPDDECIALPLLDDAGFQIINTADKTLRTINPPQAEKKGFAEGLFVPQKKAFFVSQMTTGRLYEYEYPSFAFRREIKCGGLWSKFIAWSEEKQLIAVSNWVSATVTLIDYAAGDVVLTIKTKAAPRGLAFVESGESIIVLCFDGGAIQKFDTATGALLASVSTGYTAMRHIVLNKDETVAYVSNMHHCAVYELNLASFAITRTMPVPVNPNTIVLYKNRWLFVSSRGPNNKVDYTKRSPLNGNITLIDTKEWKVVQAVEGGNQPTGLDVSHSGKYLCSSNFQDENVDIYEIIRGNTTSGK